MRQKKILVVDDDEMNLNIARMILERKLPCKVLTVDNGIDALEVLRAERVSLVLLDIMMPEFDGMETLAEIRADELIKDVPVMMLTATGEKDLIQRALSLGVRDYIKKPFLPADLITRVSKKLAEDKSEEVLLLGDDEKTLQAMQEVIEENFPHETIIATSIKVAEKILREQEIRLIIAQSDMKFIDGVKFLSLITSTEKLGAIPFAITTPDKILEVIDKINAPAIEEPPAIEEVIEEISAEEKAIDEPPKADKVADKIIQHEEKKKLSKVVTNFIGYELDLKC
ncbi:MAG: response regulator [Selenomonadaceae bacterium]|nr:response regulator [Selenomonadaceae bacterium]